MTRKWRHILSGRLLPCALLLLFFLGGLIALAIYLPRALAPIAALERALALGVAISTAISALPAESKARRLLFLFLPWLGIVFCLFIRKPVRLANTPTPCVFDDDLSNAVSTIAYRGCGLSGCHCESAEYFRTGREMFERLLQDFENANREILLDYYILARGKFFDSVLKILEQKARMGVDVCLIYDDFGCTASLPRKFPQELRARGIKATVFHPMKPLPFGRLNRRDHRKIAVIDRNIAYTGGINLADEYIGERIFCGHWKDTAVRLTGEPANRFAALFRNRPSEEKTFSGTPCVVFGDRAERSARVGEEVFFRLITSSVKRLYLCTPYLAPSEKIGTALKAAARAGVDVRILIPHIPDRKSVFALTRSFAREFEKSGVRVREYAAGFLHAKSLALDGKYSLIGSYNLDERSLLMQAECGVFLEDEALCRSIELDFLTCWETGVAVPKITPGEAATAFFLKLFLPLL